MTGPDHDIDAAVRDALNAEVADVHASEELLDRIRRRTADIPLTTAARRRLPWVATAAAIVVGAIGVAAVLTDSDDATVTTGAEAGVEDNMTPMTPTTFSSPHTDQTVITDGTTATGDAWTLTEVWTPTPDGRGLTEPCLTVDLIDPVSVCLSKATSIPVEDPYRAGLLDYQRAPRFVFGAAPPETDKVVVRLMDGIEATASAAERTVAAGPNDSLYYAVELPGVANGAAVEFFSANGARVSGRIVSAAADAPFTLLITNQSFDNPSVTITVHIDGEEVVADAFPVDNQPTVARFPLDLPAGDHTIEVEADDGTTTSESFTTPTDAPYCGMISYWLDESGPPSLQLHFSRDPIGIG